MCFSTFYKVEIIWNNVLIHIFSHIIWCIVIALKNSKYLQNYYRIFEKERTKIKWNWNHDFKFCNTVTLRGDTCYYIIIFMFSIIFTCQKREKIFILGTALNWNYKSRFLYRNYIKQKVVQPIQRIGSELFFCSPFMLDNIIFL